MILSFLPQTVGGRRPPPPPPAMEVSSSKKATRFDQQSSNINTGNQRQHFSMPPESTASKAHAQIDAVIARSEHTMASNSQVKSNGHGRVQSKFRRKKTNNRRQNLWNPNGPRKNLRKGASHLARSESGVDPLSIITVDSLERSTFMNELVTETNKQTKINAPGNSRQSNSFLDNNRHGNGQKHSISNNGPQSNSWHVNERNTNTRRVNSRQGNRHVNQDRHTQDQLTSSLSHSVTDQTTGSKAAEHTSAGHLGQDFGSSNRFQLNFDPLSLDHGPFDITTTTDLGLLDMTTVAYDHASFVQTPGGGIHQIRHVPLEQLPLDHGQLHSGAELPVTTTQDTFAGRHLDQSLNSIVGGPEVTTTLSPEGMFSDTFGGIGQTVGSNSNVHRSDVITHGTETVVHSETFGHGRNVVESRPEVLSHGGEVAGVHRNIHEVRTAPRTLPVDKSLPKKADTKMTSSTASSGGNKQDAYFESK